MSLDQRVRWFDLRRLFGTEWAPDLELQEDEYRRPRTSRELAIEGGLPETVGQVYEAAPRPMWTTEEPTHAGYWWVRVPGHAPKVVQTYLKHGAWWFSWDGVPEAPVHNSGLEWSDRAIVVPR
jgi:hypothetical protein